MCNSQTLDGDNGVIELDCHKQLRADLHCQLGWVVWTLSSCQYWPWHVCTSCLVYRLVSQSGYVVVDDTNRPQFDTSSWPWVVSKTYPTPSGDQCSAVKQEQVSGYIISITVWTCTHVNPASLFAGLHSAWEHFCIQCKQTATRISIPLCVVLQKHIFYKCKCQLWKSFGNDGWIYLKAWTCTLYRQIIAQVQGCTHTQ